MTHGVGLVFVNGPLMVLRHKGGDQDALCELHLQRAGVSALAGTGRSTKGRWSSCSVPPRVQRWYVRAVMPSSRQAVSRRAPWALASSISAMARWRSGVLIMRPRPPRSPSPFF